MRALPDLVIAAIAGRDSIAATVAACREEGYSAVLPTVVLTGTEHGDPDAPLAAVQLLRELLDGEADVLDPMRFGSPALWAAINGRFAAEIADRYHVSSPCLGCHLYVHLARVPLSWQLGSIPVVTGERDTHDGRMKLSQTRASIDAEIRVLAHAGIELLTPVRERPTQEIDILTGRQMGRPRQWMVLRPLGQLHPSGRQRRVRCGRIPALRIRVPGARGHGSGRRVARGRRGTRARLPLDRPRGPRAMTPDTQGTAPCITVTDSFLEAASASSAPTRSGSARSSASCSPNLPLQDSTGDRQGCARSDDPLVSRQPRDASGRSGRGPRRHVPLRRAAREGVRVGAQALRGVPAGGTQRSARRRRRTRTPAAGMGVPRPRPAV